MPCPLPQEKGKHAQFPIFSHVEQLVEKRLVRRVGARGLQDFLTDRRAL